MTSLDQYVAPVFYTDQAKSLNDRFFLILNQLVDTYPESKLNPTVMAAFPNQTKTNLQLYTDNMTKMMNLQNEYFIFKNSIVKSSEQIMARVNDVDAQINVLDVENKTLLSKLDEMANSGYSAEGLLDDSQITRNQMFYGNIVLFVIMASGGYMYYKKVFPSE